MARKLVSPEDYAALLNLMGTYQHLVDSGDEDGWADLFTEDGAFLGMPEDAGPPDSFRGREGLKKVPRITFGNFGGKFRHNLCSFGAVYGDTRDEAFAQYYIVGTISTPAEGAKILIQVDVRTHLVRIGGEWKIKSNRMEVV
jgi:hypothetical protein